MPSESSPANKPPSTTAEHQAVTTAESRKRIRLSAEANGWLRKSRLNVDTFRRGIRPPADAPSHAVVRVEQVQLIYTSTAAVQEVRGNRGEKIGTTCEDALRALSRPAEWVVDGNLPY